MSVLRKSLVIVSLVLFSIVVFLQFDDELSDEVAAKLAAVNWNSSSDAYLYLLGIGADINVDPLQEGERALSEIRRIEATYSKTNGYDGGTYASEPSLKIPHHDVFCSFREPGCIGKVFSEIDMDLNDEIFVTLKNRYLKFLQMDDLRSLSKPHVFEPLPDYEYLVRANRLVSLDAINQARNCCPQQAVDKLYNLIELQKRHTKEVDTLIGKMISYVLLNETIEVLSNLLRESNIEGRKIDPLIKEELSFAKVMNREFAFSRSALTVAFTEGERKWVPQWGEKMVLKMNMTSNAALPIYNHLTSLSESSQSDFETLLTSSPKIDEAWFRNYYGSLLNRMVMPSINRYVGRGFDLNAKIVLFNGLRGMPVMPEVIEAIDNPYYTAGHKAVVSADGGKVCFDGALKDSQHFRCLSLVN